MYNILIVDDEPLICDGLSDLVSSSGISIANVYIAHSGYEALDYLRIEEIDLLVTDIQMGSMNGIELMHQAKLIKPWVQTIIISAYETFQYAQMAIRLGAKDYMIKPLNNEQFLDSVRNVLLKMDKPAAAEDQFLSKMQEHFRMDEPLPQRTELYNRLLAPPQSNAAEAAKLLYERFGRRVEGPYFAVIKLKLGFAPAKAHREIPPGDAQLLQYAALNIAGELLEKEWNYLSFYSPNQEISIIIQWDESEFSEPSVNKINQLDMIGRSLHYNIHKYLNLHGVVGISQILRGIEFLSVLGEQARKAILWSREHRDHYVFYYGDFNWSTYTQDPTEEDLSAQNSLIVEKSKAYIDQYFNQKGLTLHEVAQKNHVSPNYLSYLFKKDTGYNLWEYVIKLRMEESRKLMLQTDLRRYEISERVGYESPEHFSKIFKKHFGMSPSEMKKQGSD
ncbi:response regulator transcription factor [Paenibacillus harenae]|uniref:YesN/AraC family two-component response regulator n=1 Tax=Paenibacillus harenae TaxID=306543 RepID=A0ABT9TYD6_PAEHA|nr:response regulator [Paenibacillus harenae]MDQ0111194.1 YesN/AraC family two-component response regulator [Paenibacillus harenae]